MTNTTYTSREAVRGAALAAAALLVACAAPARASAVEAGPGDWLYLTVTRGDARFSEMRGTLLLCDPPRGHARAAEACADLDAADGDVARILTKDAHCPMVYAPVTAHARGEWHGRPVEYRETFSNGCVMAAHTGVVFALDG
ncbi:SSI family serine proteinase inhibitor [Streptomyces sp. TRM68367]|uniref:SSI family serine proteinase inhibitor n=1 Tax=Streptomyces sp. TRM68367 TaxID=2758415 RepID=UPI00165A8485|nr:SSI family serine proteinase inhibitor [Streptomyces sp. TRM68367]MBC9727467.1 serine protease [Streptomyces sp. TRM68367]